jgi:hypothetical protein
MGPLGIEIRHHLDKLYWKIRQEGLGILGIDTWLKINFLIVGDLNKDRI